MASLDTPSLPRLLHYLHDGDDLTTFSLQEETLAGPSLLWTASIFSRGEGLSRFEDVRCAPLRVSSPRRGHEVGKWLAANLYPDSYLGGVAAWILDYGLDEDESDWDYDRPPTGQYLGALQGGESRDEVALFYSTAKRYFPMRRTFPSMLDAMHGVQRFFGAWRHGKLRVEERDGLLTYCWLDSTSKRG